MHSLILNYTIHNMFLVTCAILYILSFQEGDVVTVTKINANGQWEGEIGDKKGIFPFTHVKFLDENS